MTIKGWNSRYSEIRKEFRYSKRNDFESALLLNFILKQTTPIKEIQKVIQGKTIFVIGAGPSLSTAIPYLKKYKDATKIVADSALKKILESKILPDIVVTDLDGDELSLKKVGKTNSIILVHAHGDNIAKLPLVSSFKKCVGTTQTQPIGKILNFGGFTDGDRCVFLADHFNPKSIILFGMDFGKIIGKHSKTKSSVKQIKLKKLKRGKRLLEWLASKTKNNFYTTSKSINGFKKICYKDLENIINS
ncbi:MAG: 6-hydroxymethylpterin diphosphokinase MptE-like protein [Nitrosopumilaceae archaeon]